MTYVEIAEPSSENERDTNLTRTGARVAAAALIDNGVTDLFGVHGYINPIIEEACRLGARMWHFRHEQAAGFAAEAYGRVTRRPGVFFASASAGMANCLSALSQGIGTHSPMLLLVGQHGTAADRLEALQEGYAADCFTSVSKWTKRLTDWELNSYWVQKALVDAVTHPAGPIVLEFPLNNQWASGEAAQRKYRRGSGLPVIPATQADPTRVAQAVELLASAERPLLLAGDGVYWSDGGAEFVALAELLGAAAGARRTSRGIISEKHPLAFAPDYRGPLLRKADVVLLAGLRATELESWFEAPDWPSGDTTVYIQMQESAEELWHALDSKLDLLGSSKLVLGQIIAGLESRNADIPPVERPEWLAELVQARESFTRRRAETLESLRGSTPIHTYELAQAIADEAAEDATFIFDSYQGSLFLTEAITAVFAGQVLDAGPRVALGQGVGMCFGVGIARPGSQIISLIGDGGIGLSGMDIETLVRYDVPALLIILNNSSWGGNSLMQDDIQPGMGSWEMLPDLRYDKVFEPFGCHVENVTSSDELRPALRRALDSGKVAVVNVIADTDGPSKSIPWLRLKTGELYSRGIDELPEATLKHFRSLSIIEALRLHKTALDNGTRIPLSFIAQLTDHAEDDVAAVATRVGYEF